MLSFPKLMIKKEILRFVFFVLTCSLGYVSLAQTTLSFGGMKRTSLSFLVNNLDGVEHSSHQDTLIWIVPSVVFDSSALLAFRQNLINLPQIQEARFEIQKPAKQKTAHIHWELKEAQTISPLFSFGGIKGNVNVLVGINDQHLFGKGQELIAFYQLIQGKHNFLLAYKNPTVRDTRFGVSAEIRRYAAEEPVYFDAGVADYSYTNESISFGGSYRLGLRNIVSLGTVLFQENFELLEPSEELSDVPQRFKVNKLLLKAGHRLDRRNYINERIAGTEFSSAFEVVVNTTDLPFILAWHELRHYRLVGRRGNWANRLRLGIATNRESPFAPFVLDSQINIRGSGNRIDRGSAQAVLNSEYRHLIWRNRKQNLAIQSVVFSDLGSWRAPGGEFDELINGTTLRHFVGGGIRIISAKAQNAVLRLDYGIDVQGTDMRGFVLGFGQYF